MAAIGSNWVFVHIPKTGGSYVRRCLEQLGLGYTESSAETRHGGIEQVADVAQVAGRAAWGFVRHPLTWYQSWWAYTMADLAAKGGHPHSVMARVAWEARDFERFVNTATWECPGWYSGLLESRTRGLHWVGYQEALVGHLVEALTTHCGVSLACALIVTQQVRPQKTRGKLRNWGQLCEYTPRTRELVLRSEARAVAQWYQGKAEGWGQLRPAVSKIGLSWGGH